MIGAIAPVSSAPGGPQIKFRSQFPQPTINALHQFRRFIPERMLLFMVLSVPGSSSQIARFEIGVKLLRVGSLRQLQNLSVFIFSKA
ncbi:MAG: hypothetical protein FD126_697 [Elusimicrobia bacterium]|nr:MAG: hypothetical protein FD126_697 [Elusimicrobiota bacterium]